MKKGYISDAMLLLRLSLKSNLIVKHCNFQNPKDDRYLSVLSRWFSSCYQSVLSQRLLHGS